MARKERDFRKRLIGGLAAAVAARGYEATTVEDILGAAGVSRRTFYKYFDDKQDCFLASADHFNGELRKQVEAAVIGESDWNEQIRLGLSSILDALARDPDLARLCIVEPTLAGGEVAAHQLRALGDLVLVVGAGRSPRPDGREIPIHVDEAVVGGVVATIGARIIAGEATDLERLLPDLLEFFLSPYVGPDEAARLAAEAR